MKIGILASLLFCLLLGCSSAPKMTSPKSARAVDVQGDFEAAKTRGDWRFIGVQGNRGEVLIPGVPDFQEKYAMRYPVKVIVGTSSVSATPDAQAFNDAAWQYAEQYNALLLEYIASREPTSQPAETRP